MSSVIAVEEVVDLNKEVEKTFNKVGIDSELLDYIKTNKLFMDAVGKDYRVQKTLLTMLFYQLIMYPSLTVGKNIRMAINASADTSSWLQDINQVIIPFIKANEEILKTYYLTRVQGESDE